MLLSSFAAIPQAARILIEPGQYLRDAKCDASLPNESTGHFPGRNLLLRHVGYQRELRILCALSRRRRAILNAGSMHSIVYVVILTRKGLERFDCPKMTAVDSGDFPLLP
jgi:hypothetical protein